MKYPLYIHNHLENLIEDKNIEKSPIHSFAETIDFDVRTPDKLNDNKSEYEYFKSLNLDLVIVVAYGIIIPKRFLIIKQTRFY